MKNKLYALCIATVVLVMLVIPVYAQETTPETTPTSTQFITPDLIAWIGILIGVFARVMLPYLRKMWAGEITKFEVYYLWVGLAGVIGSVIVSMLVAPNILVDPEATFTQLLTANFVVGFGSTSIINEVFAFNELREGQKVTPTASPS